MQARARGRGAAEAAAAAAAPGAGPGPAASAAWRERLCARALLRATPRTEDQLREVIAHIDAQDVSPAVHGAIDGDEIAAFIADVTHHDAGPENVARVAARLAAAGWPLAGVDVGEQPAAEG